jgi:hypothetical protein
MKKILLLLLFPGLVWANDPVIVEKKMACNWISVVLGNLTRDYKEQPVWAGKQEGTSYSLFINLEKSTWTLIQFNHEIACVIGAGTQSQLLQIPSTL